MEAGLDEEIDYTKELLRALEEGIEACGNKKIQKLPQKITELLEDERLIAGISVMEGGVPDDQELPKLIEKAKENGSSSVPLILQG